MADTDANDYPENAEIVDVLPRKQVASEAMTIAEMQVAATLAAALVYRPTKMSERDVRTAVAIYQQILLALRGNEAGQNASSGQDPT